MNSPEASGTSADKLREKAKISSPSAVVNRTSNLNRPSVFSNDSIASDGIRGFRSIQQSKLSYMKESNGGRIAKRVPSYDIVHPRSDMFNTRIVSNQLLDIVLYMEAIPKKSLSLLKELLHSVNLSDSEKKRRWMNTWTDHRGLDLLQLAIVFNRADIIQLLLGEAKLFPQRHYPKSNPYAHLAAAIGDSKCLKELLTHRPKDYFPASGPQHMVKLPPDIAKRFKFGQIYGMVNKQLEKVVQMVKEESVNASKYIRNSIEEMGGCLEEELKNLEKSFKEESRKPRKRTGFYQPNPILSSTKCTQSTTSAPLLSATQEKSRKGIMCKKKMVKSKVTVFIDIFNDERFNTTHHQADEVSHVPEVNSLSQTPEHQLPCKMEHPTLSKHKSYSPIQSKTDKQQLVLPGIEMGVRRIKKYKKFHPILESKSIHFDDPLRYMDKTPLTLASENNNYECVIYLLKKYHVKRNMGPVGHSPITMAITSKCIEAIAILMKTKVYHDDYQNAVSLCLRQMYPEGLSMLLNLGEKSRAHLFGGENLFHMIYTKSTDNPEMLPEMTNVLINSGEEVNSRTMPRRYPLYSLIQSAFRVSDVKKSLYFMACLKMLLEEKANPHFDEEILLKRTSDNVLNLSRPSYKSAIHCIIENAYGSLKYLENRRWSLIILQKCIETLELHDKTSRRIHNDALFIYMDYVTELGLNRRVLSTLLRYGANPDHTSDGRYPINAFFDEMLSYLTKFQVSSKFCTCDGMIDSVLIICHAMSHSCLREAVIQFIDKHLLSTPLQALGITRKFCYHANIMLISPRSLRHIASLYIWNLVRRNAKSVQELRVSEDLKNIILP